MVLISMLLLKWLMILHAVNEVNPHLLHSLTPILKGFNVGLDIHTSDRV
jgi:hypothetical protein